MDMLAADAPIVDTRVPVESVQSQILGQSQDGFSGITGIHHAGHLTKINPTVRIRSVDNFVHTWAMTLGPSQPFANQNRVLKVTRVNPTVLIKRIDGFRTWNGFGGLVFIPSFPQLNRRKTTWPHAI
jgi:hypothetical protein